MERKTGVVIPLGALYTKESPAVGDFMSLKPFADFCSECGIKLIQLLPVNDTGTHSSPYSGLSAYALHPLYINIESLPEFENTLKTDKKFASAYKAFKKNFGYAKRFDYTALTNQKYELLHLLYANIEKRISKEEKESVQGGASVVSASGLDSFSDKFNTEIKKFIADNAWVIPYAVFKDLKDSAMQASWKSWDEQFRTMTREKINLRWRNKAHKSSHYFFVWCQLRASQQFKEAADYCRSKGIVLKGDIPILMNEDSADCWGWPEFFRQDLRAGSPPDGENPLGQNWGFPTYNWERIAADQYDWWKKRISNAANYYDAFRIDHILGFFRIWAVPESETTAFLGHTEPFAKISRATLEQAGFDEGRLHWLSEPHIPTSIIEDITWNHEEAHSILEKVCDRLGSEELWNFKKGIRGDKEIYALHFCDDESRDLNLKNALAKKWRDRALIEISPDEFIFVYHYQDSTAWKTLSWDEQQKLVELFKNNSIKENALWKQQALSVLQPIVNTSDMIPCAEDLGVNLEALPEVLQKLNILSLKVIRWNRAWGEDGQPFYPFESYPELSVATTSVHDSSTLRQWWNDEKDSVKAYLKLTQNSQFEANLDFNPQIAEFCLKTSATCKSALFVPPLQDFLYLEQSLYLQNPQDERINVPGSVNEFNWTYRMPLSVEELATKSNLIKKIQEIVNIHANQLGGNE